MSFLTPTLRSLWPAFVSRRSRSDDTTRDLPAEEDADPSDTVEDDATKSRGRRKPRSRAKTGRASTGKRSSRARPTQGGSSKSKSTRAKATRATSTRAKSITSKSTRSASTKSKATAKEDPHTTPPGDPANLSEPRRASRADGKTRGNNADSGNRKIATASANAPPRRSYGREAAALMLLAAGLYCALALASYRADPLRPEVVGANWVGPVGEVFARFGVNLVGVVSWLLPLELVLIARPLLIDKRLRLNLSRLSGNVLICVVGAALLHISLRDVTAFGHMPLGGAVGELFGTIMRGLFSTVGSFLIGVTVVALILVERATFSFIEVAQNMQRWFRKTRSWCDDKVQRLRAAWSRARDLEHERRAEERRAAEPIIATAEHADAIIAAFADDGHGGLTPYVPRVKEARDASDAVADNRGATPRKRSRKRRAKPIAVPERAPRPAEEAGAAASDNPPEATDKQRNSAPNSDALHEAPTPSPTRGKEAAATTQEVATTVMAARKEEPSAAPTEAPQAAAKEEPKIVQTMAATAAPTPAVAAPAATVQEGAVEPTIVDTSQESRVKKAARRRLAAIRSKTFQLPNPDLLDPPVKTGDALSPEQLKATARLLEKTLLDYRVEGKVQEIHPGPTVTMYEVSPAPGTKVSKVAGLADDLALGLSRKVRIIAPIPGKNRIGFEVPNEKRLPVNLRELIESQEYVDLDVPLPCVLGRDIIGRPFFADLASMPHVIVAGATGAGKSVGLNVMLVSLLYRRSPEELRILMIDPKVVELAPFDRIPHLLFPVVTDMKQASNALRWTVDEMERRYQLFADAGTRNIQTYNKWVKRVVAGEVPPPKPPKTVEAIAPDGTQLEIPTAKDGSDVELPKRLPFIVVVVEEFADLMMQQGKEVETSVARLAQKARAAGIHVILATQRPSVDVITGMIKANFPTRIAYRVSQKVDSRTILDQQGAEHLLGRGDMLVKLNGTNDVRRVQCPFVSEDEVQQVTDMLRAQGEPEYDESIVKARDDDSAKADPGDAENDPLYDRAVAVVAETKKCSTSWIQRKLGVGYNRAAKIVETMERHGIVGPPNGSKPREILVMSH